MKFKFISVLSGNDNKYNDIKNNFLMHLDKIGLSDMHELIITNTNSGNWKEKSFIETVYKKLDFTKEYLLKGYHVFCTDLDIIFLKDPIPYLMKLIKEYDMIFQNDYAEGNNKIFSVYCTGFYFVKPTEDSIQLFERNININYLNKIRLPKGEDQGDQNYINTKLRQDRFNKLKIKMLHKNNFPNGWWWFKHFNQIDPYIVHYNCLDSIEKKIIHMQKFNHWLL